MLVPGETNQLGIRTGILGRVPLDLIEDNVFADHLLAGIMNAIMNASCLIITKILHFPLPYVTLY